MKGTLDVCLTLGLILTITVVSCFSEEVNITSTESSEYLDAVRTFAELPESVLQTRTEAFILLREAVWAGLSVGIAQDEMVRHVVERNPIDGHAQGFHPGEI
jgi:hypothetical protein